MSIGTTPDAATRTATSRRIEADAIYTAGEAARLTSMHIDTIRVRLRQGVIKGSRRAGDWRIRGAELLKLA